MVRAVWMFQTEEKKYSYELLDRQTSAKYKLTKEQQQLISISEKNSDTHIFNRFNREKYRNLQTFLSEVSNDLITNYIRPKIEKNNEELIRMTLMLGTPIFQKLHNFVTPNNQLSTNYQSLKAEFNFTLSENGLVYTANFYDGNKPIELYNQNMVTLCRYPAIFIIENNLYLIDGIKSTLIEAFTRNKSINIPPHLVNNYFDTFISNFLAHFDAHANGFSITDLDIQPVPHLVVEDGITDSYEIKLGFRYNEQIVRIHEPTTRFLVVALPGNNYRRYYRKIEFEQEITKQLLNLGLKPVSGSIFSVNKNYLNALSWLNQHIDFLNEINATIDIRVKEPVYAGKIEKNIVVNEKNDWFDISGEVIFGEYRIPILKLRKQILQSIREIILPNGEKAFLPEELFARLKTVFELGKYHNGQLLLNRFHQNHLYGITHSVPKVKIPKKNKKSNFELPKLTIDLREYQKLGFNWLKNLYDCHAGGILADDMGLGKTVQIIALLKSIYSDSRHEIKIQQLSLFEQVTYIDSALPSSLIVVPTSLIDNWLSELRKLAPDLMVISYVGQRRNLSTNSLNRGKIILTTYGVLRNDFERLAKMSFEVIVLDESQTIKNPESAIFKAVKALNGKTKITLTGTPIENTLTDLWAQMDFVNPGYLGALSYFKNQYVIEIEKRKNSEKTDELKKIIEPFVLRRTKSEVAKELPEKIEQTIFCTMTTEQEKLYREHLSAVRNQVLEMLDNSALNNQYRIIALKEIMQLRLLANHPQIAGYPEIEDSGKQLVVENHLDELFSENHKTLIFSSFVRQLNLYSEFCRSRNYPYLMLTGQTPSHERIKLVNEFQKNPNINFFFISLKAGGFGLNLQAAEYVLLLDPWWNPQAENQAIDRTHRIGQQNTVFIYRFLTKNSVEEKMQQIQEKKRLLSNEIISNSTSKSLSKQEIQELLKME